MEHKMLRYDLHQKQYVEATGLDCTYYAVPCNEFEKMEKELAELHDHFDAEMGIAQVKTDEDSNRPTAHEPSGYKVKYWRYEPAYRLQTGSYVGAYRIVILTPWKLVDVDPWAVQKKWEHTDAVSLCLLLGYIYCSDMKHMTASKWKEGKNAMGGALEADYAHSAYYTITMWASDLPKWDLSPQWILNWKEKKKAAAKKKRKV